jgi:hypothetical protein
MNIISMLKIEYSIFLMMMQQYALPTDDNAPWFVFGRLLYNILYVGKSKISRTFAITPF